MAISDKLFKESLDTAVLTTRYVVKDKSPILFVFHEMDGSWQFHGNETDVDNKDIMLVGLGEIIEIDNTILEIADLPLGFEAMRSGKDGLWKITNSN
jgi:hypothetical protein